jgi:hypothetical protein
VPLDLSGKGTKKIYDDAKLSFSRSDEEPNSETYNRRDLGFDKHAPQEKDVRWMLSLRSLQRIGWDSFLLLLLAYTIVSMPLRLGFEIQADDATYWFELSCDIAFLCDVLLNFRTSYFEDDDTEVFDPKLCALNYLRTWFVLDLISSIPNLGVRPLKVAKIFMVLRLLKITKLIQGGAMENLQDWFQLNRSLFEMIKLLLITASLSHIISCFWACVPLSRLHLPSPAFSMHPPRPRPGTTFQHRHP